MFFLCSFRDISRKNAILQIIQKTFSFPCILLWCASRSLFLAKRSGHWSQFMFCKRARGSWIVSVLFRNNSRNVAHSGIEIFRTTQRSVTVHESYLFFLPRHFSSIVDGNKMSANVELFSCGMFRDEPASCSSHRDYHDEKCDFYTPVNFCTALYLVFPAKFSNN